MNETSSKQKPKYLPPQIWIPAFTAAICLAALFVLWGLNREAPNQVPSPGDGEGEGEVADWKTYRNEEYGFEVMYPEEWTASFNQSTRTLQLAEAPGDYEFAGVWVYSYDNPKNMTIEGWWGQSKDYDPSAKEGYITVDGFTALKNSLNEGLDETHVIVAKDQAIFEILRIGLNDGIFNRILSTFKFTK